jgi:metal-dependent hydrolase (beta-lactamase superfamily II)
LLPKHATIAAKVADGTRTHDHLDHNQGLYQLSYSHRARLRIAVLPQDADSAEGQSNRRECRLCRRSPQRLSEGRDPRQIIMAAQRGRIAAAMRLGGFEPPTRGLEGRRSVH